MCRAYEDDPQDVQNKDDGEPHWFAIILLIAFSLFMIGIEYYWSSVVVP